MISDFGETTYNLLSNITKLNFKAQIKDSGIEFNKIYGLTNLENGSQNFLLLVNEKTIVFKDKADFIEKFIKFLKQSIRDLENEFETINENNKNGHKNSNRDFLENDRIGFYENKQAKLLEKMNKLAEKNVG